MCRIIMAIAILLLPSIAFASFRSGDWEFTLSATGANDKDFSDFAIGGSASVGYFLTDTIELSLRETATYSTFGDSNTTTADTQLAADLHFPLGRDGWCQPFIGANVGYSYTDVSTDFFEAGPEAGVKLFVNPSTFVFFLAEYEFAFSNGSSSDDDQLLYRVGIGLRI